MSDEEMNEGDVEVGDLGNGEEDENANGAY
jgi:hypothetical protein